MKDNEIIQVQCSIASKDGEKTDFNYPKFRCILSQCLAAMATNLVKISFGTLFGFNALLLAELYEKDAEIKMTIDQLTWFSSYCFMVPVGSILIGVLTQCLGYRVTILTSAAAYSVTLLLFYYATNATMLLCGQAIYGLTTAMAFVSGHTYIVEISEPRLRNTLMATTNLFVLLGVFITVLLRSLMNWRTIALVNLSFPIAGFVAVFLIPESPAWLTSKGRFIEAELALAWLRGWVTPDVVHYEFRCLKEIYKDESNDLVKRKLENFVNALKSYNRRSFCLPLGLVCYMFLVHSLAGSMSVSVYSILIFEMINSPINQYEAGVIFHALRIVGALLCLSCIHYTGKRKLMFASILSSTLVYATVAASVFAMDNGFVAADGYAWIPTIGIFVLTVLTSGGFDKVVYMYNVELFPTRFRNVGAGIGYFVSTVFDAIMNKLFLYMVDGISLSGVFLFFSSINVLAFGTFYFVYPETSGKTLAEIEEHYTGFKEEIDKRSK